MTIAVLPQPRARPQTDAARWLASLAVVLALHAAGAIGLLVWRVPIQPAEPPPAAIMIDLAPLPTPLPAIAPPPPEPVQLPEPLPPLPEPPPAPAPAPAVALPPPPPKPIEPKRPRHRIERPTPPAPRPEPLPQVHAEPAAPAPPPAAPQRAAPMPSVAPPAPEILSQFARTLLAHLERLKRYPRDARLRREEGVVYLRFVMDRVGKVLSARIERGSGYAALDAEVLALIARAAPLPPLPPDLPQAQLELTVPVQFHLR
jgi:protein TonB